MLTPIPGSNPSGVNLRYEPVYDQIKEARREEEEIPQGEFTYEIKKADWVLVVKLAGEALAKKSKDLQIAAWLTEAQLCREGFGGLREGLDLLRGLLENFWDTLYPELEDGDAEMRATPLEWLGLRLEQLLKRVPLTRTGLDWFKYKESRTVGYEAECAGNEKRTQTRNDAIADGKLTAEAFDEAFNATPETFYQQRQEHLDGCLESLQSLGQQSGEKFGDLAPNLSPLEATLGEIKQTVRILLAKKRGPEPEARPAAAVEEEAAQEEAFEETAPAARATPKPARKALAAEPADRDDAIDRVLVAARYLRREDPYSPASFLMLRGLRWGELRAAGPEPDPAILDPPPTEVRQQLKSLARDGQWQEVLEAAETAMGTPCGRAWLDLQRYAVKACEELGSYYDPIATAIRSELRTLLVDLPQLSQSTLTDDTPTANAETQAWLRTLGGAAPPAADEFSSPRQPEEAAAEEGEAEEQVVDAYELAVKAARSGRAEEAIEILTREVAHERSGRTRFQRRVQLAQICLGARHEAIALPILEALVEEIERRKLEEWEAPDMLAHPLALLYRSMNKLNLSAEEKQKIYSRICRLDPLQALACSK